MAARSKNRPVKVPRSILILAKILDVVSPKLLTLLAARLFTTPIRHKIPKREIHMVRNSSQSMLTIDAIGKEICIYRYGSGDKKIVLVHGWSGRGTQLVKIADALVANGYEVISFDAPAHGKSSGKTTLMPEFVASIHEIDRTFGPFEAAIGHSLGGMSVLNALKHGLIINSAIIIGSGDIVSDIITEFVQKLRLPRKYNALLRQHFERNTNETMESFSAYLAAKEVKIPTLVIHDKDDYEVPVSCAHHIHKHLQQGKIHITEKLGHRKILGDPTVIETIMQFINDTNHESELITADNLISDRMPGTK